MGPKILPVEACCRVNKCLASPQSYASIMSTHSKPTPSAIAARALQELESARQADIAIHEKNLPAIENNRAIVEHVSQLMDGIGMPKRWSEKVHSPRARYPKMVGHDAGYIADLQRECKVDDGFTHATSLYERLKAEYERYAASAKEETARLERAVQAERDAELAKRKADMELAAVLLRYSLPLESSWSDVVDHLVDRDQRLRLATAMLKTRLDWSEGAYRVRDALHAFSITSDEDKEIATCIVGCIEDFDDGRVFRDCSWSYARLFAEATDQQLSADLQTAVNHSRG